MSKIRRIPVRKIVAAASLAVLASCATPPPPPPPPPPAPAPTPAPIPARPQGPDRAAYSMAVPPIDAFGVRQTVNANLTPAQTVWNFRSAMNVAALNCMRPGDEPILEAYKDMLKSFARQLSATNRALDNEFRQKYGSSFNMVRDQYMTQVYNYFALPPVLGEFCDVTLQISQNYLLAKPDNLDVYAEITLPQIEGRFLRFFGEFERWRADVTAWDAQYGERYGYIYPAYAEAQSYREQRAAAIEIAGQPVPATGAALIDVPAQTVSGPVVQPTPGSSTELPASASAYGPVSPRVQTVVEPAPAPVYSLPPEARDDAQPQFTSQPVTQPVAGPGFNLPLTGSQQPVATVSQPVVQPIGNDDGEGQ